jgi:hypothetical protein
MSLVAPITIVKNRNNLRAHQPMTGEENMVHTSNLIVIICKKGGLIFIESG